MKLKNKYSKQNIYSNQKFEDQIWYIKNFNKKMTRKKQITIIKMRTKVKIKIKF